MPGDTPGPPSGCAWAAVAKTSSRAITESRCLTRRFSQAVCPPRLTDASPLYLPRKMAPLWGIFKPFFGPATPARLPFGAVYDYESSLTFPRRGLFVTQSLDSFKCRKTLKVGSKSYVYFSLTAAEKNGLKGASKLPYSMRVLLENLLRYEDGQTVTKDDIKAVVDWLSKRTSDREIAFRPARVLMQDLTGVPAVVDLAAMRDAMKKLGGKPEKINPLQPAELVIDHSVQVDEFGTNNAYSVNAALEFQRNRERYAFLKWGQTAFRNFSAVPPGMGICHQVNLEYLARVVFTTDGENLRAYPDTLVGTDSHTTMINGLG